MRCSADVRRQWDRHIPNIPPQPDRTCKERGGWDHLSTPAERPYVVVAGVKVSAGAPTSAEALCADIAWQYKKINGLDWELFFVAVN